MTGATKLQTRLIEKYGGMLEGAIDGAIERGPDFIERVIQFEIAINIGVVILFLVLSIISLWVFIKGINKYRKECKENPYGSEPGIGVFLSAVFGVPFIIFLFVYIYELLKILYIPEIYLYSKYIAG